MLPSIRSVESINTRYGWLDVPTQPDIIADALRVYGEWGYHETQFISQFLTQKSVVWDVGAFLGTFSLSLRATGCSVVAIEGNKQVLPLLTSNLENKFESSCRIVERVVGLSSLSSHAAPQAVQGNLGGTSFRKNGCNNSSSSMVQALGEIRLLYGPADLIKLDIEGGELEALSSDAMWLRDRKPVLWLECNESSESFRLLEFLRWAGYRCFLASFPAFNTNNYNKSSVPLFPCAHEAGLLGVNHDLSPSLPQEQLSAGARLLEIVTDEDLRIGLFQTPRWGEERWQHITREEALALLGRALRGETLSSFLIGDCTNADG